MNDLQAIERVQPDLQTAQQLLSSASVERGKADLAIETAKAEHARARQAYLVDPTPEGARVVKRAKEAIEDAELLAEAMALRFESADQAQREAERVAAARDLDRVAADRDQVRVQLDDEFHTLRNVHAQAAQTIATIESLISQDAVLCARANTAARTAGVSGQAKPIDPDLVRVAFTVLISGGRPRRKSELGEASSRVLNALLAELNNEKLSLSDRATIVRLAGSELARATSAEVGDWFVPQYAPPHFLATSAAASRYRAAQALLVALMVQAQNGETQ